MRARRCACCIGYQRYQQHRDQHGEIASAGGFEGETALDLRLPPSAESTRTLVSHARQPSRANQWTAHTHTDGQRALSSLHHLQPPSSPAPENLSLTPIPFHHYRPYTPNRCPAAPRHLQGFTNQHLTPPQHIALLIALQPRQRIPNATFPLFHLPTDCPPFLYPPSYLSVSSLSLPLLLLSLLFLPPWSSIPAPTCFVCWVVCCASSLRCCCGLRWALTSM